MLKLYIKKKQRIFFIILLTVIFNINTALQAKSSGIIIDKENWAAIIKKYKSLYSSAKGKKIQIQSLSFGGLLPEEKTELNALILKKLKIKFPFFLSIEKLQKFRSVINSYFPEKGLLYIHLADFRIQGNNLELLIWRRPVKKILYCYYKLSEREKKLLHIKENEDYNFFSVEKAINKFVIQDNPERFQSFELKPLLLHSNGMYVKLCIKERIKSRIQLALETDYQLGPGLILDYKRQSFFSPSFFWNGSFSLNSDYNTLSYWKGSIGANKEFHGFLKKVNFDFRLFSEYMDKRGWSVYQGAFYHSLWSSSNTDFSQSNILPQNNYMQGGFHTFLSYPISYNFYHLFFKQNVLSFHFEYLKEIYHRYYLKWLSLQEKPFSPWLTNSFEFQFSRNKDEKLQKSSPYIYSKWTYNIERQEDVFVRLFAESRLGLYSTNYDDFTFGRQYSIENRGQSLNVNYILAGFQVFYPLLDNLLFIAPSVAHHSKAKDLNKPWDLNLWAWEFGLNLEYYSGKVIGKMQGGKIIGWRGQENEYAFKTSFYIKF